VTRKPAGPGPGAWVGGWAAPLGEAVAAAAAILGRSRQAVIAGMETDIEGAQAAIALARAIGGAVDHRHAAAALRDLGTMRQAGWIVTTPLQARARADLMLLVGPGLESAWSGLRRRLDLDHPPGLSPDRPRTVIRLCPGAEGGPGETIGAASEELSAVLSVLRALRAGRPVAPGAPCAEALARCAETLNAARYGVAVWSAAGMDELAVEMLCGLIDDLNRTTRFAGLPLSPGGNAAGVAQAAAWLTGFPLRTGFGRSGAEHDPWRFDAARLVGSGEADAALWISAFDGDAPPWAGKVPMVALIPSGTQFDAAPDVAIAVGRPGADHDAALYDPDLGTLAFRPASAPTNIPPVANILACISAQLGGNAPC
jgi:formylmethanofuran dehydrogenase subunit B